MDLTYPEKIYRNMRKHAGATNRKSMRVSIASGATKANQELPSS
jgi:hypothetical protein